MIFFLTTDVQTFQRDISAKHNPFLKKQQQTPFISPILNYKIYLQLKRSNAEKYLSIWLGKKILLLGSTRASKHNNKNTMRGLPNNSLAKYNTMQ